jgi:Kef-type K+ transport system membrane component KefB
VEEFPLIATVAVGFTAAWFLGLLTQWLRLSPIVGYLLAGALIGPTPQRLTVRCCKLKARIRLNQTLSGWWQSWRGTENDRVLFSCGPRLASSARYLPWCG